MIRFLKCISLRLWLVCLTALPFCFWSLPRLVKWLPDISMPVIAVSVCLVSGFVIGVVLDFLGIRRIRLLIREGELWERANIPQRAEQQYIRAMAIFDSAWISPLAARRAGPGLRKAAARFYLTTGSRYPGFKLAATQNLSADPGDETLALLWLRRMSDAGSISGTDAPLLTVLADTHYRNPDVAGYIVPQFLDSERTDFSARRIYRQYQAAASAGKPSDEALLSGIDILLERHGITGNLSHDTEPTLADLKSGTGYSTADADSSPGIVPLVSEEWEREKTQGRPRVVFDFFRGLGRMIYGGLDSAGSFLNAKFTGLLRRKKAVRAFEFFLLGGLGLWLLFFAWHTLSHISRATPEPAGQIESRIQKPFTIQVAAYLKPSHAYRYVETLKKKGIVPTMKKTSAGGKTWYLVRLSEFTDKKSAADYGNRLKSENIIDDFFVSNK